MKKIICAIIALFSFSTFSQVIADEPDDFYWPDNIRVEDVLFPTTDKGTREIVDASLDRFTGKVDVVFTEAVDKVDVSIVEQTSGMVVSQVKCNTSAEAAATLDAPMNEGSYMLHIKGQSYEGIGFFEM